MSLTTRSICCIARGLVPGNSILPCVIPLIQYCQFIPIKNIPTKIIKRCYKSEIHTDNLYPGSKVADKFAAVEPQNLSTVSSSLFNGVIPIKEIDIKYTRSSAPGGQNVNKSATKVEARFKLDTATWLDSDTKDILREKWAGQLTKDGYFVVKSDRTRSQLLNQADVLAKLRHSIWTAVEEYMTRVEQQQVDDVEAERRRKAQVKATRERVREKRVRSQILKDKKSYDEWDS